jgi:hypothetical protein
MSCAAMSGGRSEVETLLRLSLLPFALYSTALGVLTLVFPGPLNEVMGYAVPPSCYPWIRIIAPMALPLGLGLFLAIYEPRRNIALLQATLVLAACQVPLGVYFLASGWFHFGQIGLDLVMLVATAGAIVAFYPERRALVRFRQGPSDRGAGRADRALRLCLAVMAAYLLGGWVFATFLPQLMNDLLQYPLAPSCLPWVQYTGPLALALGVAFALAMDDPARNYAIIAVVGISGCALEIALDLYLIWQGAIELRMASIDLPIAVYGLVTFSRAAPALARRWQPVAA